MADKQTIAVYDSWARDYLKLAPSRPGRDLHHMITTVGIGTKVIDLGCGPGMPSAHMRDAGLIPNPVYALYKMVALTNKNHNMGARIGTFALLKGDQIYDGIWAGFSLLHAEKSKLQGHLSAIQQALKPEGLLIIGMKLGSGSRRNDLGRLYTYYSTQEL